MRYALLLLLVLGLPMGLAGCLLVDRDLELTYEPSAGGRIAALEAASRPDVPPINVVTFADERATGDGPSGKRIGEVRNFLDLRVAELTTDDNVTAWVTDALALELERAGFEVLRSEPGDKPPQGHVHLTGVLQHLDSSPKKPWDAEIELQAELWVEDRRQLYRRYSGLAEGTTDDDDPIAAAFGRALRNALLQLIADVDHVLADRP